MIKSITFFLLIAIPASAKEIKVTLFNQPCTLSGPFHEQALQAIHAISPERIPAQQSLSSVKAALIQVRETKNIPSVLQNYQGRLSRRLEAQFQFLEQFMVLKKSGDVKHFLESTARLVPAPAPFKTAVEAEAKKTNPKKWNKETIAKITEIFESGIEPYPEEEFHRTIERAGVRYACSFDDTETHPTSDESAE